jgi:hypothetical protein
VEKFIFERCLVGSSSSTQAIQLRTFEIPLEANVGIILRLGSDLLFLNSLYPTIRR